MSGGDHYIYVIAQLIDGQLSRPVKVGITGSWRSRLKQVQTGSPYKVDYAWVFNAPNRDIARQLETAFHTTQQDYRLSGEWFDLNPLDAVHLMALNIKVALEVNLPDWSEEDRQVAFALTRGQEALDFIEKLRKDGAEK